MFLLIVFFLSHICDQCNKQRSNCHACSDKTQQKKYEVFHQSRLDEKTNAPNDKIEGTQIPTNNPCSFDPVNHKVTDKTNDRKAASKIVTLLILKYLFMDCS